MFTNRVFSRNRWVAIIGGALFVLLGLLGFTVTNRFVGAPGVPLLGLIELNGLQNLVHIALGAALILSGFIAGRAVARINTLIGTLLFALGYYGLFVTDEPSNLLALSSWGNALHFASAAVLLAVGLGADLRSRHGSDVEDAAPSTPQR